MEAPNFEQYLNVFLLRVNKVLVVVLLVPGLLCILFTCLVKHINKVPSLSINNSVFPSLYAPTPTIILCLLLLEIDTLC